MKVKLNVSKPFMEKLMDRFDYESPEHAAYDALTILDFIGRELERDRIIISVEKDGEAPIRLMMNSFENIIKL